MVSVLVLGDVMLDVTVQGTVYRQSPEDLQAPVVQADDFYYNLGGAANVAEILAGQGHRVTLAGAIADDWGGHVVCSLCELSDIKMKLKRSLPVTATKIRLWDGDRYLIRSDIERVVEVTPDYGTIWGYDAVILSDYCRGVFHYGWGELLGGYEARNLIPPVVVDCKPQSPLAIFRGADAMAPNLKEAIRMAEDLEVDWGTVEELAESLREECDVACMAVTMGHDGAVGATAHEARHFAVPQMTHPQVIGAGDAFTAALAVALAEGSDYLDAVEIACAEANDYVSRAREAVAGSRLSGM